MKNKRIIAGARRILHIVPAAVISLLLLCNIYILAARNIFGVKAPTFLGFSGAVVLTGSMSGTIEPDDMILSQRRKDYEVGDIITFVDGRSMVTHRIIEVLPEGYRTKGDANNAPDAGAPVKKEAVVGKVILVIPKIGGVVRFIKTLFGNSFSRYVENTNGGDAARVASFRELSITETGDFVEPDKWVIVPGVDMVKKAVVNFEGSEMACYIFLEIEAGGWEHTDTHTYSVTDSGDVLLRWKVVAGESGWTYLSSTDNGAVYYRILPSNTKLHADVIDSEGTITVSPDLTRTGLEALPADLSISIGAAAVQYQGFGEGLAEGYTADDRAAAAWNVIKGGNAK